MNFILYHLNNFILQRNFQFINFIQMFNLDGHQNFYRMYYQFN
jgi:hypothetical protein